MADLLELELAVNQDDMIVDDSVVDDGIAKLKESAKTRKGRGFNTSVTREVYEDFDSIKGDMASDSIAQRSIEGYILMVTGIHEEAHEDDVNVKFSEYGDIKNLHLNLDRRTGFLKGYALVEYEKFEEAQQAKNELNGTEILGVKINVDWAFVKKPKSTRSSRRH